MEIVTHNLPETKALAREVVAKLAPKPAQATILLLFGDLGAGKTSFTQGLAEALGVTETVISPTFVIEKIYDLPVGQKFRQLIHLDCYRLETSTELLKLGWAELIANPEHLVVVEWPEKVADILPTDAIKLSFVFNSDETRTITYGD